MTRRSSISQGKGQEQKTQQFLSTGMNRGSSASSPTMEDPTRSAIKLLRSCSEISVRKFMQAHCNGTLEVLIVYGEPMQHELLQAWNEIVFDYSSRLKSTESSHINDLILQISSLQFHIGYVDNAVFLLRHRYVKEVTEYLQYLGYRFLNFTGMDEDWQRQLNRVVSQCKTRIYDLDQLMDEYDRINKTTTGQRLTEDEFIRNVAMLSKYQQTWIDKEKMMMDDYIAIFNNYLEEQRAISKNAGN
jgi:hypothetical protein